MAGPEKFEVKDIASKQSFQKQREDWEAFNRTADEKKILTPITNLLDAMTSDNEVKKLDADLDLIFGAFLKSGAYKNL
jgi:hypothetical protein